MTSHDLHSVNVDMCRCQDEHHTLTSSPTINHALPKGEESQKTCAMTDNWTIFPVLNVLYSYCVRLKSTVSVSVAATLNL